MIRVALAALALAALPAAAQADPHAAHDHDAPAARTGTGHLDFEALEHRFGSVPEGEVATHTFRFTNTGTQPVRLVNVQASCGCTTPRYTTDAVAPGATGDLVVEYHSQGRPGPFDKTVTLAADGADTPVMTLRITGTVVADFATSGVPAGTGLQHAFALQNAGTAPLRIRAVRAMPDAGVEITFPDRPLFAGDAAALMVTVADVSALARPNGRFEIALSVETTDAEQPVKSLLLRGRAVAIPTAAD